MLGIMKEQPRSVELLCYINTLGFRVNPFPSPTLDSGFLCHICLILLLPVHLFFLLLFLFLNGRPSRPPTYARTGYFMPVSHIPVAW